MSREGASVVSAKSVDPSITANIYASGMLDDVVRDAIVPFWEELQRSQSDGNSFLWLMRYAVRGEHLKIRLHCPPVVKDSLKQELLDLLNAWIGKLDGAEAVQVRSINPAAPAIDVEDQVETPHQDRTVLWTQYRRTHISLPGSPWLNDDTFAELAYACLSRSTNLLMQAIAERGTLTDGSKQSMLAKTLITALGAAGLESPALAAEYFSFHRDWLLRFFLRESSKEEELRRRFTGQAYRSAARAGLTELAERVWREGSSRPWPAAIQNMAGYVRCFDGNDEYQIDPFTTNIAFPPLFKMFHGMANQFGVMPLQEAYVHHLLYTLMDEDDAADYETLQATDRRATERLPSEIFDARSVEQQPA